MKEGPLNRILLAAVVLLALGEVALFVEISQLGPSGNAGGTPFAAQSATSTASAQEAPTNTLVPLEGSVQSISGGVLTISNGTSDDEISVSSGTTIVQEGTLKDAATYEADLQKFQQQSEQLMQNPQQNQAALETLIAPSRNIETTISLSQITPGESAAVFANGQSAGGVYEAFRIEVTPTQQ